MNNVQHGHSEYYRFTICPKEVVERVSFKPFGIEPFFVVYDFEFKDLVVVDGNPYDNVYEDAIVVYDSDWDDNLGPSFTKYYN